MSAEKDIVNYWLNKNGFFTIKDLKAGNKNIDMLAIKINENKFQHVEVSCSISGSEVSFKDGLKGFISAKFENQGVIKTINSSIKQCIGKEHSYEKVLVLSRIPRSRKDDIIGMFNSKNISIVEFENILCDVIKDIDTKYNKDGVLRSLQLMKYLLLADPVQLSTLLEKSCILNNNTRSEFLAALLKQDLTRKSLSNTADEKEIAYLFKSTQFKKPKNLAKMIVEDILGKRSKKKFLTALFEDEKMKKMARKSIAKEAPEAPAVIIKKEKPLSDFLQ